MKRKFGIALLWTVLLLPYAGLYVAWRWYRAQLREIPRARVIVVSKQDMTLTLWNYAGRKLMEVPVATGKNPGDKIVPGDMKTPEGVFRVSDVEDASAWTHDFGDGKGEIPGAYGDFFIRLDTPGHTGIGIHGTHDPASLGTRASEGCIRLRNEDLNRLVRRVRPGRVVVIVPAAVDIRASAASKTPVAEGSAKP